MAEVGVYLRSNNSACAAMEQVVQDCVRSSSEYLCRWRLHNPLRKPVPLSDHTFLKWQKVGWFSDKCLNNMPCQYHVHVFADCIMQT